MIRRLVAASIWAPGVADPTDAWLTAKRYWLPLFDLVMISAGINAVLYGSLLLDRLYGPFTDVIGAVFALAGLACLIGVGWPRLWAVELVGKIVLVSMIIGYAGGIILSPSAEQIALKEAPNWFVVSMIGGLIFLPIARLDRVIDEWVDRRAQKRRESHD